MIPKFQHSLIAVALITLLELVVIVRVLLRPHRDPASRIAWIVVVCVLPLFGMFAYLLLGEVNIGRRRLQRLHAVLKRMPQILRLLPATPPSFQFPFPNATSISLRSVIRSAVSIL